MVWYVKALNGVCETQVTVVNEVFGKVLVCHIYGMIVVMTRGYTQAVMDGKYEAWVSRLVAVDVCCVMKNISR
jgi:hypothetical protein